MTPDFPRAHTLRRDDQRGVVLPTRIMLVAIVVVALAAAMYVATSPGRSEQVAQKSAGSAATPTAKQTASAPASPAATPSSSASGSTWLTPTPSAKASTKPSPSAKPSAQVASPTRAVRRGATFVEVFNNTKRKGLAGRAANRAKGVGWKVVGSDNWYGTIPTTTVYYPKGMGQAAKALARDLGIGRVKPTIAPMRSDRLTVILTSDFHLSRA